MGPGAENQMTREAYEALSSCDVIIGYQVYLDLLGEQFSHIEKRSTPMTKEMERCHLCYQEAMKGKQVAMICSGDAGVYGMAAPMYELLPQYPKASLHVIPGVTAALSGAARLGAPINHDFCVISLSDLLTPWEVIEKRLKAAAMGDFVVVLYNPSSKKRSDYLKKACEILLQNGGNPKQACGYIKQIGREGEETYFCTLEELKDEKVDMFTTVFIGNQRTELASSYMVTKRGYQL